MATTGGDAPQIFICYDKTYQERALELHHRLANDLHGKLGRDTGVFIDREHLAAADAWDARIRAALASARLLIVLVNDGLVTRPYCRFEVETFRARIRAGESCRILPVRWQGDSEIYRAGPLGAAEAQAMDRAYFDSLPAEAVALVEALREIQFLDGVALREEMIGSETFNAAFGRLSAEATRLYRAALRQPARTEPEPASPPAGGGRSRAVALGALAAVALVAAGVVAWAPWADRPPRIETPPGEIEPPSPEWAAVEGTIENRSGGEVVVRRAAAADAAELEVLGPGALRPAFGVAGAVTAAEIGGERWLSYPTPVPDVRGYVPEAALGAAE